VHTHPVGVGVAAFLVGGAIGATVGGALVVRRAEEEIQKIQKARGALHNKDTRYANTPKTQQFYTKNLLAAGGPGQPAQKQSRPYSIAQSDSNLYT
jgi:hypothetical protein